MHNRRLFSVLALMVLLGALGGFKSFAIQTELFSIQFNGSDLMARDEALPTQGRAFESRQFPAAKREFLTKFSRVIQTWVPGLSDNSASAWAELAVRREWQFEVFRDSEGERLWRFALNVRPGELTKWRQLLDAQEHKEASVVRFGGFEGLEWSGENGAHRVVAIEAGNWLIVAKTSGGSSLMAEAIRSVATEGRPTSGGTDTWLKVELCSEVVSSFWPFVDLEVPGIEWSATTDDGVVRHEAALEFANPVTLGGESVGVTPSIVYDPLISFGVLRHGAALLGDFEAVTETVADSDEPVYFWSQQHPLMVSANVAIAVPDGESKWEFGGQALTSAIAEGLKDKMITKPIWDAEAKALTWRGLPILAPWMRSLKGADSDYWAAGAHVLLNSTNVPPAGLKAQYEGREDLIYYHWEITGGRFAQWLRTSLLMSIVSDRGSVKLNAPTHAWLQEVAGLMGNTITEVTQENEHIWRIKRRAPMVLTGFELLVLSDWLARPEFPEAPLTLPFLPLREMPTPEELERLKAQKR